MRGIFIATGLEARSMIEFLGLKSVSETPFPIYLAENIILTITGIGKANCAMGVAFAAMSYPLDECINCGAAGALKEGFEIGDIHPVERVIEPDRPLLTSDKYRSFKPFVQEGSVGVSLATMDRPVLSCEERKKAAAHADLADMEGAAFMQACKRFGLKGSVYKVITDIPGSPEEDIVKNIKKYEKNLAEYLQLFMKNIKSTLQINDTI